MSGWDEWFAWYPVKIADGRWRWMDWLECRRVDGGSWQYREIPQ